MVVFPNANYGKTPTHDTTATFFKTSMLPTITQCKNGRCRKLEVLSLSKRGRCLNPFAAYCISGFAVDYQTKSSLLYSLAVCAGVVNKMASPATSMGHTTLL